MDVCKNMVEMTRTDPEWMPKIITGDETWVYQYDPETKREPKPKKARFTKSKVKTLLVTFFYINGLVHREFIPFGRTINQEVYLGIMRRLKEAILHVDNARPHTAHVVLQFLAKHSIIQIPHPPYSPDIAPNDFFLYPKLKMKLKGRKFDNVDMIQSESKATLRNLSKSDFISCFDNWKKRWNSDEFQLELILLTSKDVSGNVQDSGRRDVGKPVKKVCRAPLPQKEVLIDRSQRRGWQTGSPAGAVGREQARIVVGLKTGLCGERTSQSGGEVSLDTSRASRKHGDLPLGSATMWMILQDRYQENLTLERPTSWCNPSWTCIVWSETLNKSDIHSAKDPSDGEVEGKSHLLYSFCL
ncbi:hypothetical protein LAZ67_15002114 [Cordylochernes scorpioides]|uniref:Transposase n=1 Tax=Cordylochernes scorpioides TaxID=51811 RepID=A0ABY6L9E0_9ARAC|nr:hypothetical protein LAZ67_15002114 [Cordylochernes scorpioides]